MIIDGKKVATDMKERLLDEVKELKTKNIIPGLSVILVGDDPASKAYVRSKEKICNKLGIFSKKVLFDENVTEEELINAIDHLNNDNNIHGILIQLPLPKHINEDRVLNKVSPEKDVDCFNPVNLGRLFLGKPLYNPCTPYGIMKLMEYYDVEIKGKNAVVIGRSNIVGKPIGMMLLEKSATVSFCHSKTKNLNEYLKNADIVVVAVGKPAFITKDMVKEGAVVIDVGINEVDGKLVGDVDKEVEEKAGYFTPVPGGVGPMTITMLMENTLKACKRLHDI